MAADLALQAQLFAVGRQQQFDRGGIEADAMVERLHVVALIDATDRHHPHQHVHRLDQARIACEQRFDIKRFVGLHHEVDPRTGNVHARQVARIVDDLVYLGDHDAIVEGGRFHQCRRVFGAGAGVQVALAVGHVAGHQHHVGRQVHVQPRIQFHVRVQGAHLQHAVLQQLRDAQALGAGKGEIELVGDAALEQVEVLRQAYARHDHVQFIDLVGVQLHHGAGQEVGLFLVVPFEDHAVAAGDQQREGVDDGVGADDRAVAEVAHGLEAAALFLASRVPLARRFAVLVHIVSCHFCRMSDCHQHRLQYCPVQSTAAPQCLP